MKRPNRSGTRTKARRPLGPTLVALSVLLIASSCSSEPSPEPVPRASVGAAGQKPLIEGPSSENGDVHTVPATIASDCSAAVEQEVMQWLATVPDGATAMFAREGCYGQDGTISLDDRKDLTVDGNGSTFKALTLGAPDRSKWRVRSGSNITIRNMIVRGSLTERKYVNALEWQHGYAFQGTSGGLLENVQAYNVYGDFVEAQIDSRLKASARTAPPATDIVVRNSRFDMAGRMGIGLTSVDGFLIENSHVGDVALSSVDVEPDLVGQQAKNIRILGNTFGRASHSMFVSLGKGGSPHVGNAVVADNVMEAAGDTCMTPILVRSPTKDRRSDYTFRNNRLLANGDGVRLDGLKDVTIVGNTITHGVFGLRCPSAAGVAVYDAHDVSINGNVFAQATRPLRPDSRSTNVTEEANRLQP